MAEKVEIAVEAMLVVPVIYGCTRRVTGDDDLTGMRIAARELDGRRPIGAFVAG
jgi:hypothetical protein